MQCFNIIGRNFIYNDLRLKELTTKYFNYILRLSKPTIYRFKKNVGSSIQRIDLHE